MIRVIIIGIALVFIFGLAWALNQPTTSDCSSEVTVAPYHNMQMIPPMKIVVRPWLGQHQVYGIFMVPARYGDETKYRTTISIRGLDGTFVFEEGGEKINETEFMIPSGYYVKRVYIQTRVALWSLLSGHFGKLRSPCNWTLKFVERVK